MNITNLEILQEKLSQMNLGAFEYWLYSRDNPGWNEGYEVGYKDGESSVEADSTVAKENAYDDGYEDGYTNGLADAHEKFGEDV